MKRDVWRYHPFQPLRMSEIPDNKEFVVENTVIPAFYLKAFDDKGAWKNFEKGVWLAVDLLTIATGVGNILKFRYLLRLAVQGGKTIGRLAILKIGVSVIEITSGALSAMLSLTDGCTPAKQKGEKTLCQHLHEYLFILDLLSLSADAVIQSLLKKKARDILKVVDDTVDESIIRHLDEISEGVKGSSARFAKKVSKSLDNAPIEIHRFEDFVKPDKFESGLVLNQNTKFTASHTSNLENTIKWPSRIIMRIRQSIVTHNHPKGFGLSSTDIKFFFIYDLKELRAVTEKNGVFSLKIKDGVKIRPLEKKDILGEIDTILKKSVADDSITRDQEFDAIFELLKGKVDYINYID